MEITKEQRKVLDRFSCERLTAHKRNKKLIKSFYTVRKNSLTGYLQKDAWREDKEKKNAVYIIKTPTGKVAMYFSLKCGGLFRHLDEEGMKKKKGQLDSLKSSIEVGQAKEFLKEAAGGMDVMDYLEKLLKAKEVHSLLVRDRETDGNDWINRVHETYPAVELAQFCVNDGARKEWKKLGFTQPLGTVMFWKFVVPRMCKLRKHAGCQYAYLFAADLSEDGRLVSYYDSSLQFKKTDQLSTTKPSYDFLCEFMCQELKDIKKRRKEFFEQFNPDLEDEFFA